MMRESHIQTDRLLTPTDPDPVERLNPDSDHPVLLVCEHAGQQVPSRLAGLGVPQAALDAHIGWDIGARAVTLCLAQTLGMPAVLQRYSRMVIDCNRPPNAPDAIPPVSDGVIVPGNADLDLGARQARVTEIFTPFHKSVADLLDHPRRRVALAIHSFTPSLGGRARPWDIGFLFRRDTHTSTRLRDAVAAIRPDLHIGMNQPYQIDDASDWFVPHHGEARGIAHSLIEVRNDHIADTAGQAAIADLFASAIAAFLRKP